MSIYQRTLAETNYMMYSVQKWNDGLLTSNGERKPQHREGRSLRQIHEANEADKGPGYPKLTIETDKELRGTLKIKVTLVAIIWNKQE